MGPFDQRFLLMNYFANKIYKGYVNITSSKTLTAYTVYVRSTKQWWEKTD